MLRSMMRRRMGGGTGLLPFSDSFTRADGDLGNGWQYTAGKWTISSGSALGTPTISGEAVTNGTMELDANWANAGTPTTNERSNEQAHGGTFSRKVITDASTEGISQTVALTVGKWYYLSAWVYDAAAHTVVISRGSDINVMSIVTAGAWTQIKSVFRAVTASAALTIRLYAIGTMYVDDVSIQEITLPDMFAVRDYGVSNVAIEVDITGTWTEPQGITLCLDSITAPKYALVCRTGQIDNTDSGGKNVIVIMQCLNGTWTNLYGGLFNYTAGGTLRFEKIGNVARAFFEGVQVSDDVAVSDVGLINNTRHGLWSALPAALFDNFSITRSNLSQMNGSNSSVFSFSSKNVALISHAAPNDWVGRPNIVNNGATWIMAYREGTAHGTGGVEINLRFSTDEGATWTADNVFTDANPCVGLPLTGHAGMTDMAESLLFIAPNGDILLHAYERPSSSTYQYRSVDGGFTWTDEGKIDADNGIYAAQDYCTVGTDIYITAIHDPVADFVHPWDLVMFKSTDNGATWVQSVIDAVNDCNEAGICNPSGNNLLLVMRGNANTTGWYYWSTDLGATWTVSHAALPANIGIIQKPRLRKFLNGIVMVGRDYLTADIQYTVVWYSPDGLTWTRKFYPDSGWYSDCGYCDLVQRAAGAFYLLSYKGSYPNGPCNVTEQIFTATA